MFTNIDKNLTMIKGSYRKLKSYYYYNKNFLVMRGKIAEFEYDRTKMQATFERLAYALATPNKNRDYFDNLIESIDYYVIPKKFEADNNVSKSIISNTLSRDKKMRTVNFFINAPIELHILDTLWTLFLSKMDNDKQILSYDVYGNTVNKKALFIDEEIDFESRTLFNRYFNKYSDWRNKAFDVLNQQYRYKRDSILVSLDIRSYFYSVAFSFDKMEGYFCAHNLLDEIKPLTKIMEKVFSFYFSKIQPLRRDLDWVKKNKYPLPIGLFSSMVLGNIYLKSFDDSVNSLSNLRYYGRYVDDLLVVVDKTMGKEDNVNKLIEEIFITTGILKKDVNNYALNNYEGLYIQADKIKLLYIDHTESKAIIDIYNDTIRIVPSQMDPLPENNLSITNFDEIAYSVENFTKEKKIRDIGFVDIDAFKVSRFFSALPRKYSQINKSKIYSEIKSHILQIEKFFTGSQGVEFYSNWLNYMYFLVVTEEAKELHSFIRKAKLQINALKALSLDKKVYKKTATINRKAKEYLILHLETCVNIALCLNIPLANRGFKRYLNQAKMCEAANIFEHNLVALPLANYLDYEELNVSLCKMTLNDLGVYPSKIEESFKFIWSPRFIHYDELLLLLFYSYHNKNRNHKPYKYVDDSLVSKFANINFLKNVPFIIESTPDDSKGIKENEEYLIRTIKTPPYDEVMPKEVKVAIGSLNIEFQKCINACKSRWANITLAEKELFFDILRESYECLIGKKEGKISPTKAKKETMFLVLPELSYPIYWINDLIRFAKYSGIGIVTGLQYLGDTSGRQYNYIATILPFETGKMKYSNAFLYIREKNDYSPIEFEELAKNGYYCQNKEIAEYQVFKWKGIRLSSMVCYELTDIMARALLKGRCDFIAASVFNPDTTYFSNIIDSTSRDLHAFIVQANTSFYGDSRVTGPYDRDSKDVFKIKGGDNDHVVIGTINFEKFKDFQISYYKNFKDKILKIQKERNNKNPKYPQKDKSKPNIKPLSARFKNIDE